MAERHSILDFHTTLPDFLKAYSYEKQSQRKQPPGRRAFVFGHLPGSPRFPEENVDVAKAGLWAKLDKLDTQEQINELITCSGAAGADALAFEWVFEKLKQDPSREITIMMYLPFNNGSFIDHSVWVSKSRALNRRWLHDFRRATKMGVVFRPHLKGKPEFEMAWNKPSVTLPFKGRRFNVDPRIFRFKNSAPSYDDVRAESARLNGGDKYQHYIDVNTHMLGLLRKPNESTGFKGDALVALWDGNEAQAKDPKTGLPKPGGTYDILYQAKGMGITNIYITQEGLGNTSTALLPEFPEPAK
ncbi:MAG TPA: hypothetical protein VF189_01740 [Patescibacteria group bacterium]